ncbi:MAG: 50S ribosomal protein L7/L12 [Gammaproteobacteria bacterium]|nr:50S ribosomal protein L7/L12 [Gammaproteobacteria bacterium]MDE0303077.1 50S ribosomal protein L7/L12 [Gammaproteobacteria bacterium]MDE0612748.1 50S ribosomal protein L7/L12 [Gammaproteobacteria bacterium]
MTTASVSKEDVLDVISNMTVMEIVDLVSAMEEKFGVSAAAVAAAPAAGAAAAAPEEEAATEQTVMLASVGDNKIGVIKVIRAATGLGLKESKEMAEGAPCAVKEELPVEEAEELKKQLEEAGATVELK